MRLDHIAYRVASRPAAVKFFTEEFGYKFQDEFEIKLEDGSSAKCTSLEPPEKTISTADFLCTSFVPVGPMVPQQEVQYHLAPEIFVSDGPPGSVIDQWVQTWGRGVGGIHHMAYAVENVREKMAEWKQKGYLFTTEDPLTCENLTQIFSQPHAVTGVIYEFIERKGQRSFCKGNVAALMSSTANLNIKQ